MSEESVKFTIALNDPDLEPEEQQRFIQTLLGQLRQLDEVEQVERTEDPTLEDNSRSVMGFLVGALTAEVSASNIKGFVQFVGDRLGNKPTKILVEANGKKIELEANSRQELLEAEQVAKNLLAAMEG